MMFLAIMAVMAIGSIVIAFFEWTALFPTPWVLRVRMWMKRLHDDN